MRPCFESTVMFAAYQDLFGRDPVEGFAIAEVDIAVGVKNLDTPNPN